MRFRFTWSDLPKRSDKWQQKLMLILQIRTKQKEIVEYKFDEESSELRQSHYRQAHYQVVLSTPSFDVLKMTFCSQIKRGVVRFHIQVSCFEIGT